MTAAPAITLTGGRVVRDGRTVLDGVDLRIDPGEAVAVLGPNGSGKSTLVQALVGLLPLAAGRLEVLGGPLSGLDRRRLGYVPQRVTAASGVPATVREVVTSGRLRRIPRWRRLSSADRCAVDCALDSVGLGGRAEECVSALSGGQQQRVLIARALAADPELLLLDEPTSGVDAENQEALAATMSALQVQGVTVVLVAHELGPLARVVRRAVVLRGGHVVHDGPLEQVPGALPHDEVGHAEHVAEGERHGLRFSL